MLKLTRPRQLLILFWSLLLLGSTLLTACSDNVTPTAPLPTTQTNATSQPATSTPGATPAATKVNTPGATANISATAVATPTHGTVPDNIPDISPVGDYKLFTQNWKVTLDQEISNAGVIGESDGLVFVKSRLGSLYALDAKTGASAWKVIAPAVTTTVSPETPYAVVAPGLVVLGNRAADNVTAYDAKTGQKRWEYNLKFDAPNRDAGQRFVGGFIFNKVLVVGVSSKLDPYGQQQVTPNPEYMLVVGINLDTGKEVWSALTDPPTDPNRPVRFGSLSFSDKLVLVSAPDLSVGAIEGETGNRLWRVRDLFPLRNQNSPGALYSLIPEAGQTHYPHLDRTDIQTGKLTWEKVLPVQATDDPLVVVSPDETTAYVSVVVGNKSLIYMVDLATNKVNWRLDTSAFGTYDLNPINSGVRLRNYGPTSGLSFFDRNYPDPQVWFAGGIELADVVDAPEGIYLTGKDAKGGGLYYLLGASAGDVMLCTRIDPATSLPFIGENQSYVGSLNAVGKPEIYAFKRP